ncbi:MAG: response regulator [Ignavibacteriaceae bacterium]|nr:response regulator [Ignavibacteriaceae bacterium]
MKILIADESRLIRLVIARILADENISAEIIEAERTEEVLKMLESVLPDLLIIDAGGLKISLEEITLRLQSETSSPAMILISQFPLSEVTLPPGLRDYTFLRKEYLNELPALIHELTGNLKI